MTEHDQGVLESFPGRHEIAGGELHRRHYKDVDDTKAAEINSACRSGKPPRSCVARRRGERPGGTGEYEASGAVRPALRWLDPAKSATSSTRPSGSISW